MSTSEKNNATDANVIMDAIRSKYREERDKRLKKEGNDQYIHIDGEFSYFVDDPYITSVDSRDPISAQHDTVIIGAGFGGILSAAHLQKAGITDVRIIEKAGGFGGAWYWNRYPGLACDMKSYVYLPLLEETGYMPPRNYATGTEIREHADRIVDHFNLRDKAIFQTAVTAITWQEDKKHWYISTNKGDSFQAKHVIVAKGLLSTPKLPGIKGILSYEGHTFHTSRWDYGYTGGDSSGGLTNLKGKRVGIIGTGATAAQCIPHLAEGADQLYVFQRTPSSIDHRDERDTDQDWVASLKPGWHQELIENFNMQTCGEMVEEDLVNDGWTDIISRLAVFAQSAGSSEEQKDISPEDIALVVEMTDYQKMEEIRARAEEIVNDPETAENLKPYYRMFCKRPVFHDGYLETFNRDNVTLVDTDGQGVIEMGGKGPIINGKEYEVDCLIFASGFEIGMEFFHKLGFEVSGRDELSLSDKWSDGIQSFQSMHVHGFPNLYIHQASQGALPANFCHGLNEVAMNIAYVINRCITEGNATLEATSEAEAAWVEKCSELPAGKAEFLEGCTPGYYNNEGRVDPRVVKNQAYGGGPANFFRLLKSWREDGSMKGLKST